MYEEIPKRPLDMKILLIKIGIFLVIGIILVIMFYFTTKATAPTSDEQLKFNSNLQSFENAAIEYFNESELPTKLNEAVTVDFKLLFEENKLSNFTYDLNDCILKNSYSKLTYISENTYSIKTTLSCNNKNSYNIYTLTK